VRHFKKLHDNRHFLGISLTVEAALSGDESLRDNCNPLVNVIIFNNIIGLNMFPRQLTII